MQIVRTVVWVVLVIALALFSLNNWHPVEIKIWEGLILETKLPALVFVSFLLGLVPMWTLSKAGRWRLNRRINALENTVRATATPPLTGTSTQLDAASGETIASDTSKAG
jgi:lipopolysaccharide assembly protein A